MSVPSVGLEKSNSEARQISLAKRDKLAWIILNDIEIVDRMAFYISVLAPWSKFPSDRKQNIEIAHMTNVSVENVRQWRRGLVTKNITVANYLFFLTFNRFDNDWLKMAVAFGNSIDRPLLVEAGIKLEASQ